MAKFQFSGGGGVFCNAKTENTQSAKKWLNFNFRGGGVFCNPFCRIWTKFSSTPAGSCITDSLSHTTYVETNKLSELLPYVIAIADAPNQSLMLSVNGSLCVGLHFMLKSPNDICRGEKVWNEIQEISLLNGISLLPEHPRIHKNILQEFGLFIGMTKKTVNNGVSLCSGNI